MPGHYASSRQSRRERDRPIVKEDVERLPSMDQIKYYDDNLSDSGASGSSSSSISDYAVIRNMSSNSGHKLERSARWMRKGKAVPWGPSFDEFNNHRRTKKRMRAIVQDILPEAARESGVPPPQNIIDRQMKLERKARRKEEEKEFRLPHLRSPSPPLTTTQFHPILAVPRTYIDIMISPPLRHSLAEDDMEMGLLRTANDLLESERPLLQSLGRLKDVLRLRNTDVPDAAKLHVDSRTRVPIGGTILPNETSVTDYGVQSRLALIPALPRITDTDNLWKVTQELLQQNPSPAIKYSATKIGTAQPSSNSIPTLTPVHELFVVPNGLTLTAIPRPPDPTYGRHVGHVNPTRYNLDLSQQVRAVDDALERLNELLADCNEYRERLEEARNRVADVARVKKLVWGIVKDRAGREVDAREAAM